MFDPIWKRAPEAFSLQTQIAPPAGLLAEQQLAGVQAELAEAQATASEAQNSLAITLGELGSEHDLVTILQAELKAVRAELEAARLLASAEPDHEALAEEPITEEPAVKPADRDAEEALIPPLESDLMPRTRKRGEGAIRRRTLAIMALIQHVGEDGRIEGSNIMQIVGKDVSLSYKDWQLARTELQAMGCAAFEKVSPEAKRFKSAAVYPEAVLRAIGAGAFSEHVDVAQLIEAKFSPSSNGNGHHPEADGLGDAIETVDPEPEAHIEPDPEPAPAPAPKQRVGPPMSARTRRALGESLIAERPGADKEETLPTFLTHTHRTRSKKNSSLVNPRRS
jgi:hypothetical protein